MPSSAESNVPLDSTLPKASLSITLLGGTRPPAPTTVGAIAGPSSAGYTVTRSSSVVVRLSVLEPPGRNSVIRPETVTASPAATVGAEDVKTKIASEVAGSASALGSCIQKPLPRTAVTTPGTCDVRCPASGDKCALPWISWIRYVGAAVVNDHEWSCCIWSGGSTVSASATFAARTVTVQLSFSAKSLPGSSVYVAGPPDTVAGCAPLVEHEIENQSPVVETSSLNVMLMPESRATSAAPEAGVVAVTRGASSVTTSQECGAVALLRGAVGAAVKSAAVLLASVQPPLLCRADNLLGRAGRGGGGGGGRGGMPRRCSRASRSPSPARPCPRRQPWRSATGCRPRRGPEAEPRPPPGSLRARGSSGSAGSSPSA